MQASTEQLKTSMQDKDRELQRMRSIHQIRLMTSKDQEKSGNTKTT